MSFASESVLYPTAFIDKVKPLIHEGIVEYMAQLDAGDLNAKAQAAAIRELLAMERIQSPMGFVPGESLCLAALIDPSEYDADSEEFPTVSDMHLARIFGSACLLVNFPIRDRVLLDPTNILPTLIDSTMIVQPSFLSDLAELIRWFTRVCDRTSESQSSSWYFSATLSRIALVMIAAAQGGHGQQSGSIATLVDEILERRISAGRPVGWRMMFVIDPKIFGQEEAPWMRLAHRTLAAPPAEWVKTDQEAAVLLAHKIIDCGLTHRFGMFI